MNEIERAKAEILAARTPSIVAINEAALAHARFGPRAVALSGIIDFLSGAPQQAQTANQYYTNAANTSASAYGSAINEAQNAWNNYQGQIPQTTATTAGQVGDAYNTAEQQLINATGSPAATQFAGLEQAGLQPGFTQQQGALQAALAASGLTGSGAAANQDVQLAGQQSSALANAIAPLYSNAESQYGSLVGAGAGALSNVYGVGQNATNAAGSDQASTVSNLAGGSAGATSGLAGQGAGAAVNAYQDALNQFYSSLQTAATGIPSSSQNASVAPAASPPSNTVYSTVDAGTPAPLTQVTASPAPLSAATAPAAPGANTLSGDQTSNGYVSPYVTAGSNTPSDASAPYNPYATS